MGSKRSYSICVPAGPHVHACGLVPGGGTHPQQHKSDTAWSRGVIYPAPLHGLNVRTCRCGPHACMCLRNPRRVAGRGGGPLQRAAPSYGPPTGTIIHQHAPSPHAVRAHAASYVTLRLGADGCQFRFTTYVHPWGDLILHAGRRLHWSRGAHMHLAVDSAVSPPSVAIKVAAGAAVTGGPVYMVAPSQCRSSSTATHTGRQSGSTPRPPRLGSRRPSLMLVVEVGSRSRSFIIVVSE